MTDKPVPASGCASCHAWVASTVPLIRGQRVWAYRKCPDCLSLQILQDRPPNGPAPREIS